MLPLARWCVPCLADYLFQEALGMAHNTSSAASGEKRRSGKHGAFDSRFVQRGERINPQNKENFSSSFLIRGVVILNVASGVACE